MLSKNLIKKQSMKSVQNNRIYTNISSWYSANWITIAQGTCSSDTRSVNSSHLTSESAYLNPCISSNTCTGTTQAITEDRNGNAMHL